MCEPTTLLAASLAISLASGVAGYMSQDSQAKAQIDHQKALARANNEAALVNANAAIKEQVEQSAAERTSQVQEQASAAQQVFDLRQERLKAQGTAAASSQATGTAFDMLMAEYDRVEAQQKDVIQEQLKMQGVQHDFMVGGLRDRADAHIKSQQGFVPQPVGQPSWALAALGIGGEAAGHFGTYHDRKLAKSGS